MEQEKQIEQEIEFLRNTNRELVNMVSVVEDRIQVLKRRLSKLKSSKEDL